MIDTTTTRSPPPGQRVSLVAAAPSIFAGILFGLVFGFLLQKGGVGKFNVLIGQLLLQDFTVAKIMLTAIVVGMIGIFTLRHFGKVNFHLKSTRIGANVIGGLLFGAGFALLGYCPGTAAAALGQGSWDALFGIVGMVAGSWVFAEVSAWSKRTIETWGDFGKVMLPDLLHLPRTAFVIGLAVLLVTILAMLERYTIR